MGREAQGNQSSSADAYVPALGLRWLTPMYDALIALTTRERRFRAALIAQAIPTGGARVLDLGCGTGSLAVRIKREHAATEIVGVDGDPAVLRIARRKAARYAVAIEFDSALAHALPYRDASFDRVVSSLFFHHLSMRAKQQAAAEAFRVLRPGGELHVADWGPPSGVLLRLAFFVVQFLDGFETTRDHVSGRFTEAFSAAGFADAEQTSVIDTPLGTLRIYRARRPS